MTAPPEIDEDRVFMMIAGAREDVTDLIDAAAALPEMTEELHPVARTQTALYARASRLARKAEAYAAGAELKFRQEEAAIANRRWMAGKKAENESVVTGPDGKPRKSFRYTAPMLEAETVTDPAYKPAHDALVEARRIAGLLADLQDAIWQRGEMLRLCMGAPAHDDRTGRYRPRVAAVLWRSAAYRRRDRRHDEPPDAQAGPPQDEEG